jgi:hypothetical protein
MFENYKKGALGIKIKALLAFDGVHCFLYYVAKGKVKGN